MRLGKSHKWDPVACPYCGKVLDGQAQIDGDELPDPGSFGICIECTKVGVFDEGPVLRKPTPEEQVVIEADERIAHVQFSIAMAKAGLNPDDFPKGATDDPPT